MPSVTLEIKKEIGDLSVAKNGWKKQLTYTSWNNHPPKFDLRSWNPEHKKMSKGLTMTKEELLKLKEILNTMDFDDPELNT